MYHRRYDKVFLMLRQETAGYAIGKRPPWGSCIMELKNGTGRLTVTVQGLRPMRYAVYLLAGEESIFCGELHPEPHEGSCEMRWEFDPDAVGEGQCAEDFHTVLILAEDEKGSVSAPLTAYFGERRDWKRSFPPRKTAPPKEMPPQKKPPEETPMQKKPLAEVQLQAAETAILPQKQEKPHQAVHAPTEKEQSQGYHGSFQGLLAKFRRELENLEETGILTQEETSAIRAVGAERSADSKEEEKAEQREDVPEEQREEQKEEAENAPKQNEARHDFFAGNQELEPFGDGVPWKCLFLEELTLLSQIPLKWQKEFFFLLPYRRYHHLILREAENGLWLGLPGVYHAEEAQEAQTFGFREFRRVEGDWGYWLSFLEWEG